MRVDFVRVSSGFINIPDAVLAIPTDQNSFPCDRPTEWYSSVELPEGFEFARTCWGQTLLFYHGKEVFADVEDSKKGTRLYLHTTTKMLFTTIVRK